MANGTCGKNLVWNLENGTLTISGEGYMDNYPNSNSPWNSIRVSIKKIIIGKWVNSIGERAFDECYNLKEITIPDSITVIGDNAFFGCSSLKEITIPDSITVIGDNAFFGCSSLKEVTIPDSVTVIGDLAFVYCRFTSITIPESVTKISERTFLHCRNLTKITIPDTVTHIDRMAFGFCQNLTEIKIPDSVTEIGDKIFDGCKNLRRIYYRAGSGFETKLAEGNNAELIPVTPKIPTWQVENITLTVGGTDKIKDYSKETPPWHDYLKTVQRIVIEDGVKEISANAFSNVLRLEHVTIPESVKTIGDFAFTISHCGERTIDGGKNVLWSLERGILVIKKNPAAKSDADFSTGYESWNIVEKNFKAIKIECGIIPSKRFFEWLWQSGRDVQIKFV